MKFLTLSKSKFLRFTLRLIMAHLKGKWSNFHKMKKNERVPNDSVVQWPRTEVHMINGLQGFLYFFLLFPMKVSAKRHILWLTGYFILRVRPLMIGGGAEEWNLFLGSPFCIKRVSFDCIYGFDKPRSRIISLIHWFRLLVGDAVSRYAGPFKGLD